MKKLIYALFGLLIILSATVSAQNTEPASILLWPNGAPGSEGKTTPEHVSISAKGGKMVLQCEASDKLRPAKPEAVRACAPKLRNARIL